MPHILTSSYYYKHHIFTATHHYYFISLIPHIITASYSAYQVQEQYRFPRRLLFGKSHQIRSMKTHEDAIETNWFKVKLKECASDRLSLNAIVHKNFTNFPMSKNQYSKKTSPPYIFGIGHFQCLHCFKLRTH